MEFLNGHFSRGVSGHKLESSQTRVFDWFSTLLYFPFNKMLFMNRLECSCFAGFYKDFFKTRKSGFLKIRVERL
jgi:hypothetical protein